MSVDLFWAPVVPPKERSLPRALKYVVSRAWWGHDGSLHSTRKQLTADDLDYLRGIRDATPDDDVKNGANALIAAIERHGTIEVWTAS